MIYIGIDPGVTGGIAYIQRNSSSEGSHQAVHDGIPDYIKVFPMPDTEAGIKNLFQLILGTRVGYAPLDPLGGTGYMEPVKALIEQVHAMPKQGVTSMFTFGRNYGFLRGMMVAMNIPFEEVTPQRWQAYFGLKKDKDEEKRNYKKRILQKAQNMHPQCSVALQTADSLMIAEYLRRIDGK